MTPKTSSNPLRGFICEEWLSSVTNVTPVFCVFYRLQGITSWKHSYRMCLWLIRQPMRVRTRRENNIKDIGYSCLSTVKAVIQLIACSTKQVCSSLTTHCSFTL
ncbi:hypothetical protein L596_019230 [Steinernema carpocapsae]|uniref:Uncharacterized protein n=1 Tax=Steinernema carpocapsae TaxID=34508 RepID=A0A4U5MPT5_STECR|nr:hypothetical protein L596_019230 [Steinernema carpocapsae]